MRIYAEASEEALRARRLLKEWTHNGFISKEQGERLEQDAVSDLRTTNIFLRLVLFFFTIIVLAAAGGLFFLVFLARPSQETSGIFLLIFAAISYAGAEIAVTQAHLYRFGIEEALVVCSVALLCSGLGALLFRGFGHSSHVAELVLPAAGAVASLWIWHRFGLWYGFPAAMIFALLLPGYWTSSHAAEHVFIVMLYAAGLTVLVAIRSRNRSDILGEAYSLSEALLWLGIYLILNFKISDSNLPSLWWDNAMAASEFAGPFYWTTWVLTWCLPPVVIARGVRLKDRSILAVGGIVAVLTLVTNKSYLGWQRHTWDPMLLGIALTGVAIFLRTWLAKGPGGVRHGFTAARLSTKEKSAMNTGSSIVGMLSPHAITPSPQTSGPDVPSSGGASGGAGASGDF